MNAVRKYAVWIIGLGLAAFIIPSIISGIGKFNNNAGSSIQPSKVPYEPPFRQDGTVLVVNGTDTTATFRTEYAKSAETIEIGMMYRRTVLMDMSMLFFMPDGDQPRSFWMKNTIVPLDIIYINSSHEVVSVQANAEPLSLKSLPSNAPASFVLETLGGAAAAAEIRVGTKLYWLDK